MQHLKNSKIITMKKLTSSVLVVSFLNCINTLDYIELQIETYSMGKQQMKF